MCICQWSERAAAIRAMQYRVSHKDPDGNGGETSTKVCSAVDITWPLGLRDAAKRLRQSTPEYESPSSMETVSAMDGTRPAVQGSVLITTNKPV